MKKKKENINVTLTYVIGKIKSEKGIYEGGVEEPKYIDEIVVWAENREEFDDQKSEFREIQGHQVNLSGSKRALYELGRYLIALSKFKTSIPDYHDHFDEIGKLEDKPQCELIIHGPMRLTQK